MGLAVFGFFELGLEGGEALVDGFFEGVGGFGGYFVALVGLDEAHDGLFVDGAFGAFDSEVDVYVGEVGESACDACGFFLYEGVETVADFEVDCLDFDVHSVCVLDVRHVVVFCGLSCGPWACPPETKEGGTRVASVFVCARMREVVVF